MRHWLIQANPLKWRIFDWWESADQELTAWTFTKPASEFKRGDAFALWVSGPEAGVYAVGTVARGGVSVTDFVADEYWTDPPSPPVWQVKLETDLYLFEDPVSRADLTSDPAFANALVLRMPRYGNPIPVERSEWSALLSHLPRGAPRKRASVRPAPTNGVTIVTERRRGAVSEDITVSPRLAERTMSFREARLVAAYERSIGRPLPVRTAVLSTGERLVVDGYDAETNTLLEAKASASRSDIRMAIGQLLDYRRHIAPSANLVVLLPASPSEDLVELAHSLNIGIVVQNGPRFTRL